MDSKDIIGFAINRASAINQLWNLYIGVATGLVGIMASGKVFTTNILLKTFLTIAFLVFAYSNLDAIIRLGELRSALLEMLKPEMNPLRDSLAPAKHWQYIAFHGVLDLLVIAAIWFVPWTR